MRGRGKGSGFERDLSRELSLWWTKGLRDDVFWRTSQSGGRSKTRMKTGRSTFGQYGDLQAVDPIGRPLMDLLTIECKKGYNKESAFNTIDNLPIAGTLHMTQWERFLRQAILDSSNGDTPHWLLIHRRDARATCVFMPMALYMHLEQNLRHARPGIVLTLRDGTELFGTTLAEFKKHVEPDDIVYVNSRIITVRRIV